MSRLHTFIIATILFAAITCGAASGQSNSQWVIFSTRNSGIPADEVDAVACDKIRSSVWVGTPDEVAELKGSDWTKFDPNSNDNNPEGAGSIVITPDDSVWVGGGSYDYTSIAEFNGTSWSSYEGDILSIPDITSMVYDRSRDFMWIATNDNGLMLFNLPDQLFARYDYSDNGVLNNDVLSTVALDSAGNVWVSDVQGMEKFTYIRQSPVFQPVITDTLVYQQSDGTSSLPQITNTALPTDGPTAIAVGSSNVLWLGTLKVGLVKYEDGLATRYNSSTTAGFLDDHVHCVGIDKCGDIWAGTSGGAVEYDGSTWQWFTTGNSPLPNDTVLSIAVDADGHVWLGTKGGLAEYKPQPHSPQLSLPANSSAVDTNSVECTWQAACPGVTRYWFEISDNSSLAGSTIDSNVAGTEKSVTGLSDKTTYYWRVRGHNDAGWGEYSQTFSFNTSIATGVTDNRGLPKQFALGQNYPNPFNPTTNIEFRIADFGFVSLKVYDILGREVKTLVNQVEQRGSYSVTLNARDLPSGVYFYKLTAGDFSAIKKLVILK